MCQARSGKRQKYVCILLCLNVLACDPPNVFTGLEQQWQAQPHPLHGPTQPDGLLEFAQVLATKLAPLFQYRSTPIIRCTGNFDHTFAPRTLPVLPTHSLTLKLLMFLVIVSKDRCWYDMYLIDSFDASKYQTFDVSCRTSFALLPWRSARVACLYSILDVFFLHTHVDIVSI